MQYCYNQMDQSIYVHKFIFISWNRGENQQYQLFDDDIEQNMRSTKF
jgi:hypothetical protein